MLVFHATHSNVNRGQDEITSFLVLLIYWSGVVPFPSL